MRREERHSRAFRSWLLQLPLPHGRVRIFRYETARAWYWPREPKDHRYGQSLIAGRGRWTETRGSPAEKPGS